MAWNTFSEKVKNPPGFRSMNNFIFDFGTCVAVSMLRDINIMFTLDLEKRAREISSESRSRQRDWRRSPANVQTLPYHNINWDSNSRSQFKLFWGILLYRNTPFYVLVCYEYPLQWVTRLYLHHPALPLPPRDAHEQTRARARENLTRRWTNLQILLRGRKA